MERSEKHAFQPLKMGNMNISKYVKIKYVTAFLLRARSSWI